MIVTTTNTVDGAQVETYLGVVAGETLLGANIFRDIGAQVRNIIGGRAAGYEKELRKARDTALEEMVAQAQELGADAVIGVDLDYETVGGSMLMVTASGTAVRLKR